MQSAATDLSAAAYAMFALLQPLSMDELRSATPLQAFPLATSSTPDWFSAAASDEWSLLETAPELLVLSPDMEDSEDVDVSGIDLIHVYAPELQGIEELDEEPDPAPADPKDTPAPATPRTSTQMGLLKELSGLDN
jgi:hypothetical protein